MDDSLCFSRRYLGELSGENTSATAKNSIQRSESLCCRPTVRRPPLLYFGNQDSKSLFTIVAVHAISSMTGIVQSNGLLILEHQRIHNMNIRPRCKPAGLKNQLMI